MNFQDLSAKLKWRSLELVIKVGCKPEHLPKLILFWINRSKFICPGAYFLNTQMSLSPSSSERTDMLQRIFHNKAKQAIQNKIVNLNCLEKHHKQLVSLPYFNPPCVYKSLRLLVFNCQQTAYNKMHSSNQTRFEFILWLHSLCLKNSI